ncbi:MAG: hypothetical protein AAF217_06115 [Pseudomonadota bacterium]
MGNKITAGETTNKPSLVICVEKKRSLSELTTIDFQIPKTVTFQIIDDNNPSNVIATKVETDVIETGKAICQTGPGAEGGAAIFNSERGQGTWGVTMRFPDLNSPPALISCNHATTKNGTTDNWIFYPQYDNQYAYVSGYYPINTVTPEQAAQHPDWQDPFWETVSNYYDFAWATLNDENIDIMKIDGVTVNQPIAPKVEDKIVMYGSVNGARTATIKSVAFDYFVDLNFGGLQALFVGGIKLDKVISSAGDSGAILVHEDDNKNIVGMLTGTMNDGSYGTWFPGVPRS